MSYDNGWSNPRWEYKVEVLNLAQEPYNSPQARLNNLGLDRWEFVTMMSAGNPRGDLMVVLKRILP